MSSTPDDDRAYRLLADLGHPSSWLPAQDGYPGFCGSCRTLTVRTWVYAVDDHGEPSLRLCVKCWRKRWERASRT